MLALDHRSGRGKTSGLELEQMRTTAAVLFRVRDGKVLRLVVYLDRERALAELGLAPEADSPGSSLRLPDALSLATALVSGAELSTLDQRLGRIAAREVPTA